MVASVPELQKRTCSNEGTMSTTRSAISTSYGFGVPVLASTSGGIPEIVDEGKTGFLYDPMKTNALFEKLKELLSEQDILANMRPHCIEKSILFQPKVPSEKEYPSTTHNTVLSRPWFSLLSKMDWSSPREKYGPQK